MLTLKKFKELKMSNRDKPVIYRLLSTIIGECEQISNNPSNNEILGVIQKIYKDNQTTLSECPKDRVTLIYELNLENDFINQYLPEQLSKEELQAIIGNQISLKKKMPDIMKYLNTEYKGRYDGKSAILLIKELEI